MSESLPNPHRIGIMVIPSDPYWIQALEAMVHANREFGDELVLLQPAATNQDLELIPNTDLVDQILANELDVLIITGSSIPLIQALIDEGLKVVCLAEMVEFRRPNLTVMADLFEGGKIAGEYIAEKLNHAGRAVCVTAGLENLTVTGQYRLNGFCSALQAFPKIQVDHIPAYWSYSLAYPALLTALAKVPHRIDAIFGVSDTLILSARDAGRKLGIIDDRTVLVGLNGDPMALAAISEGELSATVDTSSEDLGATTMKLAHRIALGLPVPDVIPQKFQLITIDNVGSVASRKLAAIARIPSYLVEYSRQQEQDRLSQLEISMEITRQIGALQDRQRVIQVVSELVRSYFGYEWIQILQWSQVEKKLVPFGGNPSDPSRQIPVEADWLLNQAFQTKEVIYIPDTKTSRRWRAGKEWEPIRSRALLPIQLGTEVVGILDLQASQPVRRLTLEIVGLKLLASQLGIVIQNTDLYLAALQARQSAERANQLKNRLMANVGHEMRSPLNAILGFSQSILKRLDQKSTIPEQELRSDIQNVYRSGEHLMYMINDLLDLSRAEIGALSLYFEPIQPAPFFKELFTSFSQAESTTPDLKWVLDVPDRLPVIRADTVRLRQIMLNLLVNARKFTRRGSITLGAAVEPPYLHLWVQDTGQGIPIELQQKIFEPFGTIGRKRRPDGIGLGLSITRHLVALHDGMLSLESQPGVGSVFHIYLPLPGIAQEPTHAPVSGSQAMMLVISSQPQIPDEILQICRRQQLTPRRISSRIELNQALSEGIPQAVAWDSSHASSAEWQLFHQFSNRQECMALPVVMYGADDQPGSLSTGLTNIVIKPCSGNVLKEWLSLMDPSQESEAPILVVDDDPEARRYYQTLLASTHPQRAVIFAENGSQALELLQSYSPGLILLDLIMPEVDGFTVLEKIRTNPKTRCVPVLVCSGKLLTYQDLERLNYYRTSFYTKGVLDQAETEAVFDRLGKEPRPLPQSTSLLVKQVLAFIHQNYTQPINRKEIAATVGLSENYLSQIFRQEITISPWDYLNRFRIQKAKELLQQSQETITQVAIQVGFNDSAYFSRVFHKQTGLSPQEYRQSIRQ